MRRPAAFFALGLVVGIALEYSCSFVGVATGLLCTAAWLLRRLRLQGTPRSVEVSTSGEVLLAVVLGLFIGGIRSALPLTSRPADHVAQLASNEKVTTAVVGRIINDPTERRVAVPPLRWCTFQLDVEAVLEDGERRGARGLIQVYVTTTVRTPRLCYGDTVLLVGSLARPAVPTNPGQFNFPAHLAADGIHAVLSVKAWNEVKVLAQGGGAVVWRTALQAREHLAGRVDALMEPGTAALVKSVLLGQRSDLPVYVRDLFERTGLLHLLAISGLHTALLACLVHFVLRQLRIPDRASCVLVVVFAASYCLLVGARPSVVRASIMIAIYLFGRVLRREPDALNTLGLAALAILLYRPEEVFDTGFQLSFLAVLGLILLAKPLLVTVRQRLARQVEATWPVRLLTERTVPFLASALVVSVVASLATAPLILYRFHIVTPGSVVLNLVAPLLLAGVLASGAAMLVVASLGDLVAWPLVVVTEVAAEALQGLASWGACLPWMYAYLPDVRLWQVAAAYLLLLGLVWSVRSRNGHRLITLYAAVLFVLALVPYGPRPVPAGSARLTVLDVSNGSAVYLETSTGVALFDCGSTRIMPGRRYICPALWNAGHSRLEHVFLSHADHDHTGGLEETMDRFSVGQVYVGEGFRRSAKGRQLLDEVRRRGIAVVTLRKGDQVELGGKVVATVLGPPSHSGPKRAMPDRTVARVCSSAPGPSPKRGAPTRARRSEALLHSNDASLVVHVAVGRRSILFTGDIEERGTRSLLASGADVGADVLIVPHHGGRNRESGALARAVRPQLAIVSSRRGFSEPSVAVALEDAGAVVTGTAWCGAVSVTLDAAGVAWQEFAAR
ncbi:ComEC/Rec2 family competence protein [Planctomycetota bacterium]